MGKTCSMDPEKGFHEVHIEDNIEAILCKRKIELYNAVVEEREDFTVEAEVLRGVTSTKNTILHVAVKSGKTKIAKKIIDFDPSLLLERNSKGNTPLHIAASLGHLDMTKFLLSQHQHMTVPLLNITNESNETALHGAVRNGHNEIVKKLIEKCPSLTSLRNKDGESPLFIAVDRGFFDIATHILDIEECCEYRGSKGKNVLHAAAIRIDKSESPNMFKFINFNFAHTSVYIYFRIFVSLYSKIISIHKKNKIKNKKNTQFTIMKEREAFVTVEHSVLLVSSWKTTFLVF